MEEGDENNRPKEPESCQGRSPSSALIAFTLQVVQEDSSRARGGSAERERRGIHEGGKE